MAIRFFQEGTSYKPAYPLKTRRWITEVAEREEKSIGEISFIFSSEDFLFTLNKQYLNHFTDTDIITFDYSNHETIIGDIFISVNRVRENAKKYQTSESREMLRVMIHGILHLIGYTDKSKSQKNRMREKEDLYLSLWEKKFHVKHKFAQKRTK